MIGPTSIVTANVGDSRTVLFSNGVARALSDDHKPDRPDERERVTAAGSVVGKRPRDCYRAWSPRIWPVQITSDADTDTAPYCTIL